MSRAFDYIVDNGGLVSDRVYQYIGKVVCVFNYNQKNLYKFYLLK